MGKAHSTDMCREDAGLTTCYVRKHSAITPESESVMEAGECSKYDKQMPLHMLTLIHPKDLHYLM